MAQKTVVEWLKDKLKETYDKEGKLPLAYTLHLVEQAKQMEKEQIVEAFYEGMKTNPFDPNRGRGKMYYEETYKKE